MRSDPHRIRAETIDGQGFTEVVFRRPFDWRSLVFFVVITAFWLFGNAFAFLLMAAMGSTVHPWFFGIWIFGWTIGGLFIGFIFLWGLFSVESLIARADSLTLMRRLLILKLPTVMPAASILSIDWVADDPLRKVTVNGTRVLQPGIAITATGQTVRCAAGIAEVEARRIIPLLQQRLVTGRRGR